MIAPSAAGVAGIEPDVVEERHAGGQRRVMERDEHRAVVARGQVGVEAGELLLRERAVVATGAARVQREQADRPLVCALRERLAQLARAVVVARQGDDRRSQRLEQLEDPRVLRRVAVLGEVAGDEDRVGAEPERAHVGDGAGEVPVGVARGCADVQVGELEDHDARSSAKARRTLRGARPLTTSRVSPAGVASKSSVTRSSCVCRSATRPIGKPRIATAIVHAGRRE